YPKAEIDDLWHRILLNQFHDILPGSSIHEVYEVTKQDYAEIAAKIDTLTEARLQALTPAGDGVTVFNTTGFARGDVVALPASCTASTLCDAEGNTYPVQQTAEGPVAFLGGLPAKGHKSFAAAEAAEAPAAFTIGADGRSLETPFYAVRF